VEHEVRTFTLVLYVAEHLVIHAKFENLNVESKIEDALEHLFNPIKPHLRAWTWLYNVEDRFFWPLSILDEQSPPLDATPLHYAVSCGFTWLAKRLIVTHAKDVNAKGYRNRTPLYAACKAGQVDVARMLPDHGAHRDINAKDDANWMPLYCPSWLGHLKVVQLLFQHEAPLKAQIRDNDVHLCLASERGSLEVVRLLLDHGADVHIGGGRDRAPFQAATVKGHHDVAQLLLEYGAERE
jgi:ankyrin repeat protein